MAPQPTTSSKRHPLATTAVNHHQQPLISNAYPQQQQPQLNMMPPPTPPKVGVATATTGKEPPLPRQNSKTRPPSPPKVISDKGGRLQFSRVGFLGEGGFARVYEVQDPKGNRLACKVVTKSALKTKKAKTKLYAEIKIHRSLSHPNIVTFQDCFEDDDNVYITLDLCQSGSLMDMLRRRRRFSEPETRFFMVQLIGACYYMHAHQVIHRDLKLGNLFLDANMNVQVGDFGLAALIENEGERKKTICGTPNYIAPEVLFDTANGHSFEVDVWSIGVILYTLVVGRPPFQTKEVKEIYKRIRDNEYEFPVERHISSAVKHLIQEILTPDPSQRPTLHEIVDHPFFTQGTMPASIPPSAHDGPPDFRTISRSVSEANLKRVRRASMLDVDYSQPQPSNAANIAQQREAQQQQERQRGEPREQRRNITTSIAQQEKEFQKAVQPGSPISALLSSARQPLMVGPTAPGMGGGGVRESPLLRKLQQVAPKDSPLGRRSVTRGADGALVEEDRERGGAGAQFGQFNGTGAGPFGGNAGPFGSLGSGFRNRHGMSEEEEEELRVRKKELEAQKARIVAQMAPVKEEDDDDPAEDDGEAQAQPQKKRREDDDEDEEERPLPPLPRTRTALAAEREKDKEKDKRRAYGSGEERENVPPLQSTRAAPQHKGKGREIDHPRENRDVRALREHGLPASSSTASLVPSGSATPQPKLNGFDAAAQTLTQAFEARSANRPYLNPNTTDGSWPELEEERVFIVSWVDYCNKYGMGYALTDGSVGVHFNDSTSLVLSADKMHFDYISSRRQGTVYVRKSYDVEEYPEELKSKVYLLKHFEKYIMERLYGEYEYTFEDVDRKKGMEWVQKYLRMKHVIVFKMSHDVLQFNFYDHSKLILSSSGLLITHIDKHYQMTRWKLVDVLKFHMSPPANASPDDVRFNGRLVDKLKYCKEVLVSIKTASGAAGGDEGATTKERDDEAPRRRSEDRVRGSDERARGSREDVRRMAGASKVSLR